MNQSPKYLIKLLEGHGYIFKRGKGSQKVYYNSISNSTIIVPVHGNKDIKKGTFLAILKLAGIDVNGL